MTLSAPIDWNTRLARRAREMKPSALRQLLRVTNRPGMISLAGGLPDPNLFPLARVEAAVHSVLSRLGGRALQYGETEGVHELREWIVQRYSTPSLPLTIDNVLITTGAQQGLDLVGRVLLDEGDAVIVENPTYMAALLAWSPLGARFVPALADDHGLNIEALPPLLGDRPKMLYLIPNFQNPTGATLAAERRSLLLKSISESAVAIYEDNPYAELRYEGAALPTLLELDRPPDHGGRVIQAGTFSKTLMPGLRIGWLIGPRPLIERMGRAKQAMDLHTSTFNQYLVLELIRAGYLEEMTPKLQAAYRARRDAMLAALQTHMPPASRWTRPKGGMFVFVTLPPDLNAAELLPRALAHNVAFIPGAEFHLDGSGQNTMRLNFTRSTPDEIELAIQRLAQAMRH